MLPAATEADGPTIQFVFCAVVLDNLEDTTLSLMQRLQRNNRSWRSMVLLRKTVYSLRWREPVPVLERLRIKSFGGNAGTG